MAFWIGLGDYADFIGYTDAKRFDPDAVADWISVKDLGRLGQRSIERVRQLLLPIKDKCLGLLVGNHERKYEIATQQESQLHGWLCSELGVPMLGYCCLVDLVFSRAPGKAHIAKESSGTSSQTFRLFAHHGAGYANTPGGKLNRLIGFMDSFDADIYLAGHTHDRTAKRITSLGANEDCSKLRQRVKVGVISGSYLKTYEETTTTYGEQKAYRPVALGASRVTIKPETREILADI